MNAVLYVVRLREAVVEPVGVRPIDDGFSFRTKWIDVFRCLVGGVSLDAKGKIHCGTKYLYHGKWDFTYADKQGWEYLGKVMLAAVDFTDLSKE